MIFKLVIVCSSTIILLLSVFSSNFINLLGSSEYQTAKYLILPLTLGLSVEVLNEITGIGFFISKKIYYYTFSYIIFIFSFLIGFLFFTPIYGYLGIGISIFFSYLIKTVFITFFSNRLYPVNWPYNIAIFYVSLSFLIGFQSL